jgi:periplasmic protein CpxP/Spy
LRGIVSFMVEHAPPRERADGGVRRLQIRVQTMKISLRMLVAAASLALAAPVYAQGGGGGGGGGQQMTPEQRMARQKEQLFKDITLEAPVSAKVDSIMMDGQKKQAEAMQAARSGGGDMAAMREGMQKMTADRNNAIKALLTDEQKKKFDENVAAMPAGRGRGGE